MPARVTAKNVGGVFLRHSVYIAPAFSQKTASEKIVCIDFAQLVTVAFASIGKISLIGHITSSSIKSNIKRTRYRINMMRHMHGPTLTAGVNGVATCR